MKFDFISKAIKSSWKLMLPILLTGLVFILVSTSVDFVIEPFKSIGLSLGSTLITIAILSLTTEAINAQKIVSMIELFGDHKLEGVDRFYFSETADYKRDKEESLCNCNEYKLITIIGRNMIGTEEKIQNAIKLSNKCKFFNVLFMDNKSEGYKYRYDYMEPKKDLNIIGRFEENKKNILIAQTTLIEHVNKNKDKDKYVGFFKVITPFRLEFIDKVLFVSFYGINSRAEYSPIIKITKVNNSKLYKYFEMQFNYYLNESIRDC